MLSTAKKNNLKFLQVYSDNFVIKVPEGTENAIARINKLGKTIWELRYPSIDDCIISNAMLENSPFGEVIKLTLKSQDENGTEENYLLSLPLEGSAFRILSKILPNINKQKPISISLSKDKEDRVSLYVSQDNVSLKHFYNKTNLPEWVKTEKIVRGKTETKWDRSTQDEFLWENSIKPFLEYYGKGNSVSSNSVEPEPENIEPVEGEGLNTEDINDIPFN